MQEIPGNHPDRLLAEPITLEDGRIVRILGDGQTIIVSASTSTIFFTESYVQALGEGVMSEGIAKLGQAALLSPPGMDGLWMPHQILAEA
ncbi:MAG TPA: hypothetical protein VLE91_00275 [Candidatus Saccharimonadales bacterium]|nr:hypothetical protein [Candidatus Saccharimonadales bacterium]